MTEPVQPDRYSRQERFRPFGADGQQRLRGMHVVMVGCGALGSHLAESMVRGGLGRLTIIDRDYLELHNLQRQSLFDEADVAAALPKAEAARRKLTAINSTVTVEAVVADLTPGNAEGLLRAADVIADACDNLETRFLVNDVAVMLGKPWVYGACIGATGMQTTIVPGQTPCLRCLYAEAPPAGAQPTCETAGVLWSAAAMVVALQLTDILRLAAGEATPHRLARFDLWMDRFQKTDLTRARVEECPCCGQGRYDYLQGRLGVGAVRACGRTAVQVSAPPGTRVDLDALAGRLADVGEVTHNPFLVRLVLPAHQLTVFADGRAIVSGTDDPDAARSLYARYVGT